MDIKKVEIVSEEAMPSEKSNFSKSRLSVLLELLRSAFYILTIAFLIRYFLVQPFIVEGSSMEPNFLNQEYLLVSKVSYQLKEPKRGDVIVFRPVESPYLNYIKRVIGLPGETVEIKNGKVWIDKEELKEDYLPRDVKTLISSGTKTITVKLKEDQYFVLGDNRQFSKDSREIGAIPRVNIVGPAWMIVFPFNKMGPVFHPE